MVLRLVSGPAFWFNGRNQDKVKRLWRKVQEQDLTEPTAEDLRINRPAVPSGTWESPDEAEKSKNYPPNGQARTSHGPSSLTSS